MVLLIVDEYISQVCYVKNIRFWHILCDISKGIGKSGMIAQRMAASVSYISFPAEFVNGSDWIHGDFGKLRPSEISNNPQKNLIVITNKHLTTDNYSGNVYDMDSASKDGVVYPSLDPSIFELKFPDSDIEGRVLGDK